MMGVKPIRTACLQALSMTVRPATFKAAPTASSWVARMMTGRLLVSVFVLTAPSIPSWFAQRLFGAAAFIGRVDL